MPKSNAIDVEKTIWSKMATATVAYRDIVAKNDDIHDNVIGMYINRYYFIAGSFLKSA